MTRDTEAERLAAMLRELEEQNARWERVKERLGSLGPVPDEFARELARELDASADRSTANTRPRGLQNGLRG